MYFFCVTVLLHKRRCIWSCVAAALSALHCMTSAIMYCTFDMYFIHSIQGICRVYDVHACCVQDIDEQFLWDSCPITNFLFMDVQLNVLLVLGEYEGSQ